MSDYGVVDFSKIQTALRKNDGVFEVLRKTQAALRKNQWGSCDGCGQHRICPECWAPRERWSDNGEVFDGQHFAGCSIAEALGLAVREKE